MCRWLGYIGEPITPYKYLYEEEFSLIEQSHNARKSKSVVNGDGFGLGWYGERPEPGRFRDILPAWSDENLRSLAQQIQSGLFMAHVRAATDTPTNRTNCHPFTDGRSMFIHNGQIGGYASLRRSVESLIPDMLYSHRLGSTDSEALFLYLESLLESQPFHVAIQQLIAAVEEIMKQGKIRAPFRFTSAYTDGEQIYAVRYASDEKAPSLYFDRVDNGWIIVSEPLDGELGKWALVPRNHTMIIKRDASAPIVTPL